MMNWSRVSNLVSEETFQDFLWVLQCSRNIEMRLEIRSTNLVDSYQET